MSTQAPAGTARTVIEYLVLGAFACAILAFVGYNALSGFGPRVTEAAQIRSIDIQYPQDSVQSRTYWVEGETESGRSWRMASSEAYDAAERLGYPMDVEVVISEWNGDTVALRGESFEIDRSGDAHRLGWLVATAVLAVVFAGCAWLILRRHGALAVAAFVAPSPLWLWLGLVIMRAVRT